MFLDRVKLSGRAGDGGDGAATFRREAHVPRGGPDGGDGGRGGSVSLRVDPGQTTLRDFRYAHHFKATPGGRGTGAKRHGKAGDDLVLAVPPGTAVYEDETGALLADLVATDQQALVARGGRGGLGNVHFATSVHRTPKHAQKGEPGETRSLRLELRQAIAKPRFLFGEAQRHIHLARRPFWLTYFFSPGHGLFPSSVTGRYSYPRDV